VTEVNIQLTESLRELMVLSRTLQGGRDRQQGKA